ncbi:MAG TPA: tripartite tricarboxylate transporter TctB family protein [Candidatus Binatia bacterium]|nr:tripartite tricarboxylate transporter TctB family protein [Candidatus Binatia bacterium]
MKKELIDNALWLALSLCLSIESYRLGLSMGNRPGPGFFPFGAAVAIGMIAGFRLLKNSRRASTADDSESITTSEARLVFYVIAGMISYVFLLGVLGFVICTFLLVAFYLKVVAARSWRVSASFAAAVALMSHLFFDLLLNAQLPRGLLDWLI